MSSKKQFLQNCWIPIEKRKPPRDDTYIIIWCSRKKQPVVKLGSILGVQLAQNYYKTDTIMDWPTHWMRLPGPNGEIACAATGDHRKQSK